MPNPLLTKVVAKHLRQVPEFRPGDTIRVHVKIKEGDKERLQVFEGTVIARNNSGLGETVKVDGQRMPYLKGKKVDPADVTADGERFENIDQFKQLLLRDKPRLARALTTKLVTYATGRAPQAADREAVEAIVAKIGKRQRYAASDAPLLTPSRYGSARGFRKIA